MAEDKMVEKKEHQSKIVSLRVENFMSIKKAFIDFSDSNIISLCGYNDSGKSAITRLFEIMFYNSYSLDHIKFITDGEDYWLGELTFSDGVVYTRIKYSDGKSLYELKKGNDILYTNKLQNGTMAALGDIPDIIVKYLGVIQDELTGEELNVRRNTDKLFLINTSGGDNYKILNSVLRSDVLSSASKRLNDDKNKLKSEVDEKTTVKGVLQEQYDSYDIPPVEEIDDVKSFMSILQEDMKRIAYLEGIVKDVETKSSICIYDKLDEIDIDRLKALQTVIGLKKETSVSIFDKVESVDMSRLVALQKIIELRKKLFNTTFEKLDIIDSNRLVDLKNLIMLFKQYKATESTYQKKSEDLKTVKSQLKELSEKNNLKVCQNCGAIVA